MITTLKVPGMMCQHCEKSIKNALRDITGVKSTLIKLDEKTVTIEHTDDVSIDLLKKALEDIGYEAE